MPTPKAGEVLSTAKKGQQVLLCGLAEVRIKTRSLYKALNSTQKVVSVLDINQGSSIVCTQSHCQEVPVKSYVHARCFTGHTQDKKVHILPKKIVVPCSLIPILPSISTYCEKTKPF